MNTGRIEVPFGSQTMIIESGKLAKQANAAVKVTVGGTVVLVTACMAKKPRTDIDFFPLMVEYQEKTYAAGKIPGGFFKREGRPTQKEILTSRVIDRPIRPLFPEGFYNDVQVVATVLSSDGENDADILALIGASTALTISDIPFAGPVGSARVGMVDGELIANPTFEQRENSDLDIVVVGLEDGIVMIEGETNELPEDKVVEALDFAFKALQPSREIQLEYAKQVGKEKATVDLFNPHPDLLAKLKEIDAGRVFAAYKIADKNEREDALSAVKGDMTGDLSIYEALKVEDRAVAIGDIKKLFDEIEYEAVRRSIFEDNKRADGRAPKDVRDVVGEIDVLPRTHGSALFTRGQTQSLGVITLGNKRDEKMVESLTGTTYQNFMLHYNFPSFSVGETRPMRGPGRREIGHGALAAKALKAVLPTKEDFPYTVRVVSEILESNGSSSMASVCAGSLSLMAAGVPLKSAVAGISVGLVTEGEKYSLLTDIMGLEDHFGDMDLKVAGTANGINAIQLDLKIKGLSLKILKEAVEQAKEARLQILGEMNKAISASKPEVSDSAPRIMKTTVPQEKIGEIIGPGGRMIKRIMEQTGAASIDIDDDGTVVISALSKDACQQAFDFVNGLVEAPIVGKIYEGEVMKVANFGAFVEFLPGRQGLVHVSELSNEFVKDVTTVVKVGDKFKVKLVEIDQMKRMNLSKKQADAKTEEKTEAAE